MLHLTSDDLRKLQALLSLLQKPARGVGFERWQGEVNRRIEELVGVDSRATPPSSNGSAAYCRDHAVRRNHLQSLVALDAELQTECMEGLLICSVGGQCTVTSGSPQVGPDQGPREAASRVGSQACPEMPSTAAERRREGLLQLLLPVFRSSVREACRGTPAAADIAEWADTLSDGAAIYGPRGRRLLHANTALRQLLDGDDGAWLRTEMEQAAAAAAHADGRVFRRVARIDERGGCGDPDASEYTFTARRLGSQQGESDRLTLVAIAVSRPPLPAAGDLRARYGLSPRECDVALLMARGLSDRDIAARLAISWHTARRHSERVLGKLSVTSRAEVALTLLAR